MKSTLCILFIILLIPGCGTLVREIDEVILPQEFSPRVEQSLMIPSRGYVGSEVTFAAKVKDPQGFEDVREVEVVHFESGAYRKMYDDGTHGDMLADDGIYTRVETLPFYDREDIEETVNITDLTYSYGLNFVIVDKDGNVNEIAEGRKDKIFSFFKAAKHLPKVDSRENSRKVCIEIARWYEDKIRDLEEHFFYEEYKDREEMLKDQVKFWRRKAGE